VVVRVVLTTLRTLKMRLAAVLVACVNRLGACPWLEPHTQLRLVQQVRTLCSTQSLHLREVPVETTQVRLAAMVVLAVVRQGPQQVRLHKAIAAEPLDMETTAELMVWVAEPVEVVLQVERVDPIHSLVLRSHIVLAVVPELVELGGLLVPTWDTVVWEQQTPIPVAELLEALVLSSFVIQTPTPLLLQPLGLRHTQTQAGTTSTYLPLAEQSNSHDLLHLLHQLDDSQ
jgi:hypothetical protein